MSNKGSNGSNRESINLRNWSISPPRANNNFFVNGRIATEENYPAFIGNVAEGNLTRSNAEVEPVLDGQLLNRNNQMIGFARARKLRPRWVTSRAPHNHYVSLQHSDAMEQGTICMIDKNGACVPIGHTDPLYTTRTTESMRIEYQQIMNDPNAILPELQRAQQLLRMIHTREAREYLERERLRRESTLGYRLQNRTRRIRNSVLSGIRGFTRGQDRRGQDERPAARSRSRTPGGTRRNRP